MGILWCAAVTNIDTSGIIAFEELEVTLKKQNIQVILQSITALRVLEKLNSAPQFAFSLHSLALTMSGLSCAIFSTLQITLHKHSKG